MDLRLYDSKKFDRGKSRLMEMLWGIVQSVFVQSSIPGSKLRKYILTFFGAKIGRNVLLRPGLKVKFPWRLSIGDDTWIGENVWVDNLANVTIGRSCCISQGAYLCTGNHDWKKNTFDLVVGEIIIGNSVWIGAMSKVAPKISIKNGAVLTMGSSLYGDAEELGVYSGVPAKLIKKRQLVLRNEQ